MYSTRMKHFHLLLPLSVLTWLRSEALRRGVGVCEVIRLILQAEVDRQKDGNKGIKEGHKNENSSFN